MMPLWSPAVLALRNIQDAHFPTGLMKLCNGNHLCREELFSRYHGEKTFPPLKPRGVQGGVVVSVHCGVDIQEAP